MKKLLILTILCGLFSCSGNANPPDKKTMSVIKKAEKVSMYLIDPMTDDYSNGKLQGYAVVGNQIEVADGEKDTLISLINETVAFFKSGETQKMSTFIPEFAFQFTKESDTVNVLLDFHADIMSFCFKDKTCKLGFAKTHKRFMSLVHSLKSNQDSSSTSESIVPKAILEKITATDSLSWYILDPFEQTSNDAENFNGAFILQQKGDKNAAAISKLLTSPSSFVKSDRIKESVFLPDLAMRMYADGKQSVDVMFSFYCNECKIISGDNIFQSDCQHIRKEVIENALKVFPLDKYLRVLSNQ